jgi:hypothetical protein
MDKNSSLISFLAVLPVIGFGVKSAMDAWSESSAKSDVYAISSIVQYSLMTLYLAAVVGLIGKLLHNGTITATPNLKCFFGALFFLLLIYVAIIILYSVYYARLKNGLITPSINESVNNLIMVPLWLLIFYNMYTFLDCQKTASCIPTISGYTLSIIAFGLMQVYLVVNSFNMLQTWPTDDIYYAQ